MAAAAVASKMHSDSPGIASDAVKFSYNVPDMTAYGDLSFRSRFDPEDRACHSWFEEDSDETLPVAGVARTVSKHERAAVPAAEESVAKEWKKLYEVDRPNDDVH